VALVGGKLVMSPMRDPAATASLHIGSSILIARIPAVCFSSSSSLAGTAEQVSSASSAP
jgi:hypothetical protein